MAGRLPRVVIVGAGIAGLAAAERLFLNGLTNITILEAAERVGGRIHTKWIGNGTSRYRVEIGANWIHGTDNENVVMNYVRKHNLATVQHPEEEITSQMALCLDQKGQIIPLEVILEVYGKIDDALERAAKIYQNNMDGCGANHQGDKGIQDFVIDEMSPYLQTLDSVDYQRAKMILDHRMMWETSMTGCHRMNQVSSHHYGSYQQLPGSHHIHKLGYQRLAEAILEGLPERCIKLRHAVEKIDVPILSKDRDNLTCRGCWECDHESRSESHSRGKSTVNHHKRDGCGIHTTEHNKYCHLCHPPENESRDISILCANDEIVDADHVIVTSSLGYLKDNACDLFMPMLPCEKQKAISRLGIGVVDKLILEFEDVDFMKGRDEILFFNDKYDPDKKTLRENWMNKLLGVRIERTARPQQEETLVIFWLTGEEAKFVETLSDSDVTEALLSTMKCYLKTDIPRPKRLLRSFWHDDPHVRGSYSYVPIGASVNDIRTLAEPINHPTTNKPMIQFAGEATHEHFYSTVHGAILTGLREADRLLEVYEMIPLVLEQ